MLKRTTLVLSLITMLTVCSKNVAAQYYFYNQDYYDSPIIFEVGGSIGAMNCLTDLGGKKGIGKRFVKDLNIGKTHLAGSVFVDAMYKNAIGLRVEGTFGNVSANDNVLAGITDIAKERFNRNLNFRSTIKEVSVMAELHPLYIFIDWTSRDDDPPKLSPYLLGGVGYFSFNPQTQLGNRWVDLQPLSTEGEGFAEYPDRKVYKLQQVNFPVGVGAKYEISPFLNLRAEFLYRILKTDYLDDVSTRYIDPALFSTYFSGAKLANALALNDRQLVQHTSPTGGGKRGSPNQNDAYFSFNIKLSFVLGREKIR
ncbi:MAG: hypothetical protein ABI091_24020 [Ferruginibacter sp.]